MAKTRKQILQELLDLENSKIEEIEEQEKNDALINEPEPTPVETMLPVEKVKKPRTQKQIEAFERAKAIRDANAVKRKEEAEKLASEMKKKAEEKIVKKAISIKKKEIKKQAVLDEISDDETPIEEIKKKLTLEKQKVKHLDKEKETLPSVKATLPSVKANNPIIKFY